MAVPASVAWEELVDLSAWPQWGPTLRSAVLDDGSGRLHPGATGRITTTVGLGLRFEIDGWHEDEATRSWSWRVAGVHATEHSVHALTSGTCRVAMSVPWWAPAYLAVVGAALRRIRHRLEDADRAGLGHGPRSR